MDAPFLHLMITAQVNSYNVIKWPSIPRWIGDFSSTNPMECKGTGLGRLNENEPDMSPGVEAFPVCW
jgi:hypothetical protein